MTNLRTMGMALAIAIVVAPACPARANTGLVLRAVGLFEGEASSNGGNNTCTVPTISTGIANSFNEMGLYNTFGFATLSFPDRTNPFAEPCGGWLEMQNNMIFQGITVDRIDVRLSINGAKRFSAFVPTRNGWPTACRSLRNINLPTGLHLYPFATTPQGVGNTGGGVPHLGFVGINPMVSAQVFRCLQQQYGALPADTYVSLPLTIKVTARGTADDGSGFSSNSVRYTLTLDHLCGNGAVDATEECDPNAPNQCNAGSCDTDTGFCTSGTLIRCVSDADCVGTCIPPGTAQECTCVF